MAKHNYIPQSGSLKESEGQKRFNDLGFSSAVVKNRKRFVNKDGSFNVERSAGGIGALHIYQWLVLMSWTKFLMTTLVFYFVLNTIFAGFYLLNGIEHLTGGTEDGMNSFWTAFFFSVQTLTTVGYGSLSPIGFGANTIAALGALTGLMSFALGTGLLFARFSKPRADILFSQNALIAPYGEEGGQALMFRLANRRKNMLVNLRIEVIATWVGSNKSGVESRHYSPLKLERDELSMLPLSWTIVHPLTKTSPIAICTQDTCEKIDLEIIVIIEGYDDTFANIVRAHSSYKYNELVWNAKFDPTFYFDEEGNTILELDKLNDFQKIK